MQNFIFRHFGGQSDGLIADTYFLEAGGRRDIAMPFHRRPLPENELFKCLKTSSYSFNAAMRIRKINSVK